MSSVKNLNLLFLMMSTALMIQCGGEKKSNSNQSRWAGFRGRATSVELKTVTEKSIAKQVKAYGTIQSDALVRINPQVSNRVVAFYVDLGDSVKVGQKLAKIYDRTFRDQVARDQAQLQQAKVAFNRDSAAFARTESLYNQELASEAEFQIASATFQATKAQLATAKAALTLSKENLSNTLVTSPVNGVVVSRTVQVGDVATAGQPLFEVANNSDFELRLFVPLQDWEQIRIGQRVDLEMTNQPGNKSLGTVTRISPQLDPITGLGEVVVNIQSSSRQLYAGALTKALVNIVEKDAAVVIPRSAMIEQVETFIDPETNSIKLDKTYSVYVSQGDTLADQRKLELGIQQGDQIEVLSGLRPGEKIVITGQSGLQDKAKIRVPSGANFRPQKENKIVKADSSEARIVKKVNQQAS